MAQILLADDQSSIRRILKTVLEVEGHAVHGVADGASALEAQAKEHFDLLITDITMPGMTGDILAKRTMLIRRDLPVIVCTGYSDPVTRQKFKAIGIKDILLKPFELNDLARTVRRVLDGEE